jgi:hypothetical protein
MIELLYKRQSRREFLRGLGRYLILGVLVSTTGVLIAKRRGRLQTCPYLNPTYRPLVKGRIGISACRGCVSFRSCELLQALSVKEKAHKPVSGGDDYARREK